MRKQKFLLPTTCLALSLCLTSTTFLTGCSQQQMSNIGEIVDVAKHLGQTESESETGNQSPGGESVPETEEQTTNPPESVPSESEPETVPAATEPVGPQVTFANVQGNVEALANANVRSEPKDDAPVIGLLLVGDVVARDGYETTWSRISYNGRTAFVKTKYLASSDLEVSDLTPGSTPIADQKIPTPIPNGGVQNPGGTSDPSKDAKPTDGAKKTDDAKPTDGAKKTDDAKPTDGAKKSDDAEPTTKSEPTETPEPTATPEPTKAPVSGNPNLHVADADQLAKEAFYWNVGPVLSRAEMEALPNDTIPFGYVTDDRDSFNRPGGCFYYQKLYGKYNATFIRENTNIIYLTMDEGYEGGFTPKILDTLKEKNVKATFFCTLDFIQKNPDLVQRMIKEGHVVGNHTDAHPSGGMPQKGLDFTQEDVMRVHNYVKDNFGYEMYLFRYPEGSFSEQNLALIQSLGYESVFWSFAHKDWDQNNQPDPTVSLNRVTDQLHPGAVYLLHAVSETNTNILGDFIDNARAQGYEFGYYGRR